MWSLNKPAVGWTSLNVIVTNVELHNRWCFKLCPIRSSGDERENASLRKCFHLSLIPKRRKNFAEECVPSSAALSSVPGKPVEISHDLSLRSQEKHRKTLRPSSDCHSGLVEAFDEQSGLHTTQAEQWKPFTLQCCPSLKQKLFNQIVTAQRLSNSLQTVGLFVPCVAGRIAASKLSYTVLAAS